MIRSMTPHDIDAVIALWLEGNQHAHPFIDATLFTDNVDFMKLVLPSSTTFVQEIDGKIKGFLGLSDNLISGLFIEPSSQHQGLGSSLLTKAKGLHNTLFVYVYEQNQNALHFFQSQGFEIVESGTNGETGLAEHLLSCEVNHSVKIGKCAL